MKIYYHFSPKAFYNSYIVQCMDTNECVLIDPAHLSVDIINTIESNNLRLTAILLTHKNQHFTSAIKTLFRVYDFKIYAYNNLNYDFDVKHIQGGDEINFGTLKINCIHIPGVGIDNIVYKINEVIFVGSIMQSALVAEDANANQRALHLKMIQERIFCLDDRTIIYTGYGPITTVLVEKFFNHDLLEAISSDDLLHLSHSSIISK